MKLMIVLGTRPEAIKLAPVIAAANADERFDVRVVFTGQHADLVPPVFEEFKVTYHDDLRCMAEGQSLSALTSRICMALDPVVASYAPDAIMAQGDTTSTLCAGMVSFYNRIPFVHVEAGLRTPDIDSPFPEELNRRICSLAATLHCCPTKDAMYNLRGENTILTGNTVVDAVRMVDLIESRRSYIIATCHRRENRGAAFGRILTALKEIDNWPDYPVILIKHPSNPDVKSIMTSEPLPYHQMIRAMANSHMVITDSGGLTEEAVSLGVPVLITRDSTERSEAVQAGSALLVGTQTRSIVKAAQDVLSGDLTLNTTLSLYGDGNASQRILDACAANFGKA